MPKLGILVISSRIRVSAIFVVQKVSSSALFDQDGTSLPALPLVTLSKMGWTSNFLDCVNLTFSEAIFFIFEKT